MYLIANSFLLYSPFEPTRLIFFECLEPYFSWLLTNSFTMLALSCIIIPFLITTFIYVKQFCFFSISLLYTFINELVISYIGKEGKQYVSIMFFLFYFILISNLLGLIPFQLAITSHLTITLNLSLLMWSSILLIGITLHASNYVLLFYPNGIPFMIIPLFIFLETMSNLFRLVSLALRLFANILSGHILLHIICLFIYTLLFTHLYGITILNVFISFIIMTLVFILIIFESIISMLQAYIFIVLSLIYLREAIYLHG